MFGISVKMTEEQKIEILKLCNAGELTYRQIGEMYGLSGARVGQIYNENNKQLTLKIKEPKPKVKRIRESNVDDEKKAKHKTRKQECCKCHKVFMTELDKLGIPYNRLCPKCHESNRYLKDNHNRGIYKSNSRRFGDE